MLSPTLREGLLGVLVLVLGYQILRPKAVDCPTNVVQTVQDDKIVREKEHSNKVIVTTTKTTTKAGTVTETTTTEKDNTQVLTTSDDKSTSTKTTTPADKDKYEVGISYLPSLSHAPTYTDSEIDFGARLGSSDFWMTTGADVKDKQFKLGLSYHW